MNPILRKEVLWSLRAKKAVAMQAAFLLAVGVLLWLLWPADGVQDLGGREVRRLLIVLSIGQLAMVVMIAPAFTASSLAIEKERNTLESLLATPMRPWEIAVGKMLGSLSFLVLVVLSGVPALASLLILGGVEAKELLAVVAVLLLAAVNLGTIGLLISVLMHRCYRAIILTYGVLLLVVFGFAVPTWPVGGTPFISRGGAVGSGIMHLLASFSPLEAMLSLLMPGGRYAAAAKGWPPFWQLYIVLSIIVTAVAAAVLLRKLHQSVAPPRPREGLKVVERGHISGRTVFFLYFFDPRRRKRHISWWQNPVLVKECRTRRMLQPHWLARATAGCVMLSVVLMMVVSISVTAFAAEATSTIFTMATAIGVLMVVMVVLIGPAFTSGAICTDREMGLWDLLRATPLPAWRIVSGKFQACLIPLVLLIVGMAPALVVLVYFERALLPNVLRVLEVVGVTSLFVTVLGMFFSSVCGKTSTATVWTYGVVSVMSLLTMLALLGKGIFDSRFIEAVFMVNPIAAAMDAAGHKTMEAYSLLRPYLQIVTTATVGLFILTIIRVFQLGKAD